jgi:hypothetical protein
MAKSPTLKTPIMTPNEERFMAFEGLVQWTQAVITQSVRASKAKDHMRSTLEQTEDRQQRRQALQALQSECHFFAIAANKLLEYRDWVRTFGLCSSVDFGEVDLFSEQDIRDLRNMREHVVDYFTGEGRAKARWVVQTPEYRADASSIVETLIGGRLDWVKFGTAAERLLPRLLAEPTPYPSQAARPSKA